MSGTAQRTGPAPIGELLNEYDFSVDLHEVVDLDPSVERVMDVGAAKRQWDLTHRQAEALFDHLGSFEEMKSWEHSREDLQQVPYIGPKTAAKMRPNMSTRLKWAVDVMEIGDILAQYEDEDGVLRHPSERDDYPEKSYDLPEYVEGV